MTDVAAQIIARQATLEGERSVWETHWRQITSRVLPRHDDIGTKRTQGAPRTELIFDSTAPQALEQFAAAMEGMLCPRAETWHGLETGVADLDKLPQVKAYFEDVTRVLFTERYSTRANFASQFHEAMTSLGAIGTAAMLADEEVGKGIIYKSFQISEIFVAEDQHGRIDTVHRKFDFTARQAEQRWGRENLPRRIVQALEKNKLDEKFEFLHAVQPRADIDSDRRDYRGMPFASFYVSLEDKLLLSEGGYQEMPMLVSRYWTAPRETYGRSPAMQVLPDIKMANEIAKTALRGAHKAADPPLMAHDDGVLGRIQNKPGGLTFGGVNSRGDKLVHTLHEAPDLSWALTMLDNSRQVIRDAFLVNLFSVLQELKTHVSPVAIMERMQEKGVLLAPTVGRQEGELLGPMIEREIGVHSRRRKLPPMPGELVEAQGEYKVRYTNPLARAQRAQEGAGFLRWTEAMAPLAQAQPDVLDMIDGEAVGRGLAEVFAVPARFLRTPDQVARLRDGRAQQADAAAVLEAAPIAGKAALDLAKAQEIAGSADV